MYIHGAQNENTWIFDTGVSEEITILLLYCIVLLVSQDIFSTQVRYFVKFHKNIK
jgi:hypothetical protein